MAPHSSTLAWKIPWTEEPGGVHGVAESDTTEQLHFHFSLSCLGEGNGNPLQYSCLENPRDRGAWWAAFYGVAQSWTRLKWLSSKPHMVKNPCASAGDIRDTGSIPGSGRSPGGQHGNPLQDSCPGESHRQRRLVGYSPQVHRVGHDWSDLACTQTTHTIQILSQEYILNILE